MITIHNGHTSALLTDENTQHLLCECGEYLKIRLRGVRQAEPDEGVEIDGD